MVQTGRADSSMEFGAVDKDEWDTAIRSVNQELGLVREVPYTAAVFLSAE